MDRYAILAAVFFALLLVSGVAQAESHEETIVVPAGTTRVVMIQLSWGDNVKGTMVVSGGILHSGVDVFINDPSNNTIANMGRVTANAEFELTGGFIRGAYKLYLVNPSWLSGKTVELNYNVDTNPLMHYNYEILGLAILGALAITAVIVYNRLRRRPGEKLPMTQPAKTTNLYCTGCGSLLPPNAEYCPKCGSSKAQNARTAKER